MGRKWSSVNSVVVEDGPDLYFFITTDRYNRNRPRDIRTALENYCFMKLQDFMIVEKVKYFTKITQRRLGWGSADATHYGVLNDV